MEISPHGLADIQDPSDRARKASDLIDEHQAAVNELSRLRREALDEMVSQGMTHAQIAHVVGMTRARVGQLLSSGPRPERAMLGSGPLTVAVGGKFEAGKANPYAVVSAEMLAAYEKLSNLARGLGLKTEYEVVPPPGMVDLNRTNLVVVGSPRILPFVGQVLASDPKLGFGSDDDGVYLVNRQTGEEFRSPSDSGEPVDYGYLGRLPRPDGRGTFLYLAGIHAMGTLGVAQYLEDHLDELYREVKNRRFSLLVACTYDPKKRAVKKVDALTPIYRSEGVA
ncbi:sigma-70 family RNA polymerase sigma factor [Micromonospora peucetia]|uniref:Sigma-70 family RNA polymerase sigma factor n=1 Tax=Micromonospora peucetia TaxID=47871 RepID=A0ABZ1ECV6_9ACTN|nr:sigma-70 family RNA polymerase sigma factor [Micromonospora peucetia]WSA32661.1 sigma-70 family RNA polymerase sigma factor [Micromonospora peucetia]